MFSNKVTKYLSSIKKYKCLNSQINSTNLGHHNIRKYTNIDNLIINSTSVFPTGGIANPTLTMLALTSRLAERLNNESR